MKPLRGIVAIAALVCSAVSVSAQSAAPPRSAQPAWRELGTSEVRHVLGMRIRNEQGREVGEVDNLLIDTRDGRISHVVIGVGGFMGVGEKKVVVPWADLKVTTDGKQPVATLEQSKLESAPRWDRLVSGDRKRSGPAASPGTTR
jgi:sporulation protein YlmC with PRC-barrel domain